MECCARGIHYHAVCYQRPDIHAAGVDMYSTTMFYYWHVHLPTPRMLIPLLCYIMLHDEDALAASIGWLGPQPNQSNASIHRRHRNPSHCKPQINRNRNDTNRHRIKSHEPYTAQSIWTLSDFSGGFVNEAPGCDAEGRWFCTNSTPRWNSQRWWIDRRSI